MDKLHQISVIFIDIALILFVFSAIFTPFSAEPIKAVPSIYTICYSLVLCAICMITFFPDAKKGKVWKNILLSVASLVLIVCSFILIDTLLKKYFAKPEYEFPLIAGTFAAIFIADLIFRATAEELIYRHYLPKRLSGFADKIVSDTARKTLLVFVELIVIALFALAHRYAGWLSVINAFVAGIILRVLYKKTENIFCPIAVHILYNVIILLDKI